MDNISLVLIQSINYFPFDAEAQPPARDELILNTHVVITALHTISLPACQYRRIG